MPVRRADLLSKAGDWIQRRCFEPHSRRDAGSAPDERLLTKLIAIAITARPEQSAHQVINGPSLSTAQNFE
jgi:hypothetical protein